MQEALTTHVVLPVPGILPPDRRLRPLQEHCNLQELLINAAGSAQWNFVSLHVLTTALQRDGAVACGDFTIKAPVHQSSGRGYKCMGTPPQVRESWRVLGSTAAWAAHTALASR